MAFNKNWAREAECRKGNERVEGETENGDIFYVKVPSRRVKDAENLDYMRAIEKIKLAKSYCERCPVKQECLDSALEQKIGHGILGGATPEERAEMLGVKGGRGTKWH